MPLVPSRPALQVSLPYAVTAPEPRRVVANHDCRWQVFCATKAKELPPLTPNFLHHNTKASANEE